MNEEIKLNPLRKDFCVFILSHGRADNVATLKILQRFNYSGPWFIVIDDLDEQQVEYKRIFGDEHVIVFDKRKAALITDAVDNFHDLRSVVYARNELWNIARRLGFRYYLMLDDDYKTLDWRFLKNHGKTLGEQAVQNLDLAFEAILEFLDSGPDYVALAQGGDFLGGATNEKVVQRKLPRKIMNTFFCDTQKEFRFLGIFNDDVNAYVDGGMRGKVFFTLIDLAITQAPTQQNDGGLTDIYLDYGTYVKSFYSIIIQPSAIKINMMGDKFRRVHHMVKWNNCVPKILSDRWKKK